MKALLYKEFKLAWHPLCYVLPILLSLTVLIPQYPSYIGLMSATITYTILFLGTNKGKQSNDLYFTACLPIRKKDIVVARFISMLVMQIIVLVLTSSLAPLSQLIINTIKAKPIGFNLNYFGVVVAFALIGYIITDACYLLMFYRNGRSIVAPSLISMFAFIAIMVVFTNVLPLTVSVYNNFFTQNIWIQFVALAITLVIYAVAHIFIVKRACKLIEKVNL